jgi:hypothetical protein
VSLIARIAATAAVLGLAAVPAVPSPATAYDAQRPLPSHVNHCWSSDNGYPVVDDATFSPSSVDVSSAPATVTMTVHAHNTRGPGPASGIRQVLALLTWPRSTRSAPPGVIRTAPQTWQATIVVPEGTAPGEVSAEIEIEDGNGFTYAMPQGGPKPSLHVTDSSPDTTPPTLSDFTMTPTDVNTTHHARS